MRLSFSELALLQLLKILPKNLLSMFVGFVMQIPFPQPLQTMMIKAFGCIFGVNWSEVKKEISSFRSIQEFFIRELKDGIRPVSEGQMDFISACDACWGQSGIIEDGMILQVKGMPYSVADFIGSEELAKRLEGGTYITLYLSPKDYHRFHIPFDLDLHRIEHIPGALWPVNKLGIMGVPGIFAKNERIIATTQLKSSMVSTDRDNLLIMVPVGATNVGKIKLSFDCEGIESNCWSPKVLVKNYEVPLSLHKGDEWGYFQFGSTVILLMPKGLLDIEFQPVGTSVKMGQKIGVLKS